MLAHGFGMTRAYRLDAWAQRFADAGLAALVFDYRGFGDSDGEPRIAAVVAQVPFVDGRALLRGRRARPDAARVRHVVRLLGNAVRDELRARRGRPPVLVPVAGEVCSGAVIAGPGAEAAIRQLVPDGVAWRNEVAARIVLRVPFDRPGRRAAEIRCPLLVAVCEHDTVTPSGSALAVAAAAPRGESVRQPFTHFEAYVGAGFEAFCADETAFLVRHLGP